MPRNEVLTANTTHVDSSAQQLIELMTVAEVAALL